MKHLIFTNQNENALLFATIVQGWLKVLNQTYL